MSVRRTSVASWLRGGQAPPDRQDELLKKMDALARKVDGLTKAVEKLAVGQKEAAKWRQIFRKQLASLVRAQYVAAGLPGPRGIEARRFRLRSQNEEDGIILALLEATGVATRKFVEIGSGGTGGNCGVLARELGWDGLMVDASEAAARAARLTFGSNPGVVVLNKRVSTATINHQLTKSGFAGEVDVLSIDIDSFDYWLLDAIEVTTSRILVMEYNAQFGPDLAVTIPNAARPKGTPKAYLGASLAALEKCARRKGYRLVLCEEMGVNAFFIRDGLAPQLPGLTPQQAYRPKIDRRTVDDSVVTKDLLGEIAARGLPLVEV